MQETWVRSLAQEDPLEEEMATHSSILAWDIPWTEEPGRLQSMGSQSASDTPEGVNNCNSRGEEDGTGGGRAHGGKKAQAQGWAGQRFRTRFPAFEGRTDRVWQRGEGT